MVFHEIPGWLNNNEEQVLTLPRPPFIPPVRVTVPRCHAYYYMQINRQQLLDSILVAVHEEANAIELYQTLLQNTPIISHTSFIQSVLENIKQHLYDFSQLYRVLAGMPPQYMIRKVTFSTYLEGLWLAYQGHLKRHMLYKNIYLNTNDESIRDIFFNAINDEIVHTNLFTFPYLNTFLSHHGDK